MSRADEVVQNHPQCPVRDTVEVIDEFNVCTYISMMHTLVYTYIYMYVYIHTYNVIHTCIHTYGHGLVQKLRKTEESRHLIQFLDEVDQVSHELLRQHQKSTQDLCVVCLL